MPKRIPWISGKVPDDSVLSGKWIWCSDITCNGADSHKSDASDGATRHSFRAGSAIRIDTGTKIIQYVYLDAGAVPSGIMLKLLLSSGEVITLYWESDEEAFAGSADYISAWYMGRIPEKGKWIELEIDCKELEITEAELAGMDFIVNKGILWWGEAILYLHES